MVEMVKAVMPAREVSWLLKGFETLSGFVVRAVDIEWATTPDELIDALGLAFPGSPIVAGMPHLDILRFDPNGFLSLEDAIGGDSAEAAARMGGPFVEPAPFTGTGFVATERAVPLWWLNPARIPAGAQLWRVFADGTRSILAVYPHVGIGWQTVPGLEVPGQGWVPPSQSMGIFATHSGARVVADVLADGRVVLASPEQLPGLTERSPRGLWWGLSDPASTSDLAGFRVRARWRGLLFDVVQRWPQVEGDVAQLLYAGRNAFEAEAAGLSKSDQGVYEAIAPWSELTDLEGVEIAPTRAGATS